MDMTINGFTIHAVVPVMRNGKPDSHYIAGVHTDDRQAVCAHTFDLSASSWAQGYYFPVSATGDLDKALEEAITAAYEMAGVLPEPARELLAWWGGLDEDERALTGVGASNLDD